MIIYLHGFRSSPASGKVSQLAARLAERGFMPEDFRCDALPPGPADAIRLIGQQIETCLESPEKRPTLIGSSLGGYYATWLAEKYDLRAVLLNPAAYAYRTLAPHVGRVNNLYTGEIFDFTPRHIDELKAIEVEKLKNPRRFYLIVETGDEILDYRESIGKYAAARHTVVQGGNHNLASFQQWIDPIIDFAMAPWPEKTQ